MIALLPGLSLTSSLTTVGALAAFAALLGIALVSLLVFSQSREIKRLREWAGRAPERAAELEQRIGAQGPARAQRTGAPAGAVRVAPRATPLVSAPVSSAVQASAAAATGSHPLTRTSALSGAAAAGPLTGAAPAPAATGATALAQGAVGQPTVVATPEALGVTPPAEEQAAAVEERKPAGGVEEQGPDVAGPNVAGDGAADAESPDGEAGAPLDTGETEGQANGAESVGESQADGAAESVGRPDAAQPTDIADEKADVPLAAGHATDATESAPAPATAAARATRSPLPPAPPPAARAAALRSSGTRPVRRPPGERGRIEAERARRAADPITRRPGQGAGASTSYYRQQRSPVRRVALMIGAAIVGVLSIALVVSVLKGSSGSSPSGNASPLIQTKSSRQNAASEGAQVASSPTEVAVVVLNGTSTAGLAHHLASALQQNGYSRAEASSAVPPGSRSTTVVEYTSGHRADAQAVAKALSVNGVEPIESSTAQLASAATVVVLAGADQAALFTGAGSGEAAASGSAETAGTEAH